MDTGFWDYWHFHLPDWLLAALTYALLARMALGLFLPPAWDNPVWRSFRRLTDPAVAAAGALTPRSVPPLLVAVFAVLWLMLLRIGFFVAMDSLGLAPGTAAADPAVLDLLD